MPELCLARRVLQKWPPQKMLSFLSMPRLWYNQNTFDKYSIHLDERICSMIYSGSKLFRIYKLNIKTLNLLYVHLFVFWIWICSSFTGSSIYSKFGKRTMSSKNNHSVSPSIIVKDSVLTMSQLILLMTKCRNVYLHMYNSPPDVPTHAKYMEKWIKWDFQVRWWARAISERVPFYWQSIPVVRREQATFSNVFSIRWLLSHNNNQSCKEKTLVGTELLLWQKDLLDHIGHWVQSC